jgi:GDP-L-fucose synthase
LNTAKIFVAGHRGMVGSAIVRALLAQGVLPGQITFDTSKPDGPPRKWMDSRRLNALGWH